MLKFRCGLVKIAVDKDSAASISAGLFFDRVIASWVKWMAAKNPTKREPPAFA
jgi:hypothetical protein